MSRDITFQDNMELLEDGYQGDVIGEATPDVIVSEFVCFSTFVLPCLYFLLFSFCAPFHPLMICSIKILNCYLPYI